MLCSDSGGWGEFTIKLLLKIHQYFCNPAIYKFLVYFPANARVHIHNKTYTLRKVVENLCDMNYQNTEKSSFHKKFGYITQPCPFNCKIEFFHSTIDIYSNIVSIAGQKSIKV